MRPVFKICRRCGNLVGMIHNSGAEMTCCGEPMQTLTANTVDASNEKHIPVVTVNGNTVEAVVGSVTHPMLPEHSIQWIALETEHGMQRKLLAPGQEPKAVFTLTDDKPVAVYEYCNLHGLWKTEL